MDQAINLVIPAPNLVVAEFVITGTAPYVQNKFSQKARDKMMLDMQEGSRSKSKKKREPRDFDADYKAATHISEDGWLGIPAPALRSALISACRVAGYVMTKAKLSVFVVADGIDKDEGTPLIRIYGEPEKHVMHGRNETGVVDIRSRPMWRNWHANIKIRYDADQFSEVDIANLLMRAGMQVGIGEGRPDSKRSHGQGWGTFTIHTKED